MTKRRRPYDQACGVAHGLDVAGDRWALLIIRELLLGPKRFADLKSGLGGISANVLSHRLDELEKTGVLVKQTLPPPASVSYYELTDWGYQAEPIIQALSRWGVKSDSFNLSKPMTETSLVLSFRAFFDRSKLAKKERGRVGFRFASEQYVVEFDAKGIRVERGPPIVADATFEGAVSDIAEAIYLERPAKGVAVTGDRELAERFVSLFDFPARSAAS